MKVELKYVQQRGNGLFFRIRIPENLRDSHYGGRREIRKTLNTSDPLLAYQLAEAWSRSYKKQFETALVGMTPENSYAAPVPPLMAQSAPMFTLFQEQSEGDSMLLSGLLEEVLIAKPCKHKTALDRKIAIKQLIDWHGDRPLNQYSRKVLLEFRDNALKRLPKNAHKDKRYRGKSLNAILKLSKPPLLSSRSINNKLGHIGTVFGYAVKHGYIGRSPSIDMMLPLEKAPSEQRDVFTKHQIQRLVDGLALEKGCMKDQRFWVTMIALYSGARLNEIAQLSVGDIKMTDGIPCFHFTSSGSKLKSIKNAASDRLVPIHPVLLDLGLIRYHKIRSKELKDKTDPLWPKATCDKDGNWGRKMSRCFNDHFKPSKVLSKSELQAYRKGERSWCFHSLRHTFINQSQNQAQMNARIEMRYVGHTDTFISEEHRRYGKDMHPSVMLGEIQKLDYGLDLSSCLAMY